MSFAITERMLAASLGTDLTPQLVFEIEGFPTLFASTSIKRVIRYGDTDLDFGDGDVYGGFRALENQQEGISFQKGTSTKISQTLTLDKGLGESISSMRIAIVDLDEYITKNLLKPDDTQTPTFDVLGRRCKVWFGFEETGFKEDFIIVFRGVIQSVDSGTGIVTFNINHPDDKKRSTLFVKGETELSGAMTAGATVADVDATTDFIAPVTGPSGSIDTSIKHYLKISDEIMQYEVVAPTQFGTLTRGAFGTTAVTHDINDSVESFYTLTGTAIDLALKLMLSGTDGPAFEDVSVTSFVNIGGVDTVVNSIFFQNVDVEREYGLSVGDFITTTGATFGANNITLEAITGITATDLGSYLTVDPASDLILETGTAALIDFRSQYDTLGEGAGAAMKMDEVDVEQHLFINRTFLSSQDYEFYLFEEINIKEFLSEQIYNPAAAFSLPRKSQASVGYHLAGQLPGTNSKVLKHNKRNKPCKA